MRRGEIEYRFTCKSEALSASRVGNEQVYAERADRFDPPAPTPDTNTQYSYRRQRKASTTHSVIWRGSVQFPIITGDRLPLLEEFLESIVDESPYIIGASMVPGVMRDLEVFTPASQLNHNRIRSCDKYALLLPFESINHSGAPVSVSAIELAISTQSTVVVGGDGTTLRRFAHYHFPGTEVSRTLACTLAGNDMTVTVNGHEVIKHSGASQVYSVAVDSSMQSSGTNIIRVESLSPDTVWSIRNVTIT